MPITHVRYGLTRSVAFDWRAAHVKMGCAKAGATIHYGWAFCVRNGWVSIRTLRWLSSVLCISKPNAVSYSTTERILYERHLYRKARSLIRFRPRRNEQGVVALESQLGICAPAEFTSVPDAVCEKHGQVDGEGSRRDVGCESLLQHPHSG